MSVEQTDRAFQRALREQLARNELTFAHAPIGQAIVELDGSWRQVNSALLQMLEYDEADLLAMTFQDITHPEDLDLDLGLLQQTLDGEITSYQMEKRYFTRTGRTVWALLSVALVRDEDDQPLYFISQILDITAHKKQVQALQDFTAMLAHDLRTPAAVIAGFAQLLSTGPYDDEVTSIARRIERASTTIVDLLENALTTESIDSGRLTARPTAVDVRDAVTTAVQAALSAAEMNEQQLEVDTSGLVPAVAWVDPVHLEQVMTNVIGNARKYGGSHVRVSTRVADRRVEILVEDDGPGVPVRFVPQLFERYSRSQEARTSKQRGSGLGLYIVGGLTRAHGGEVVIDDAPAGGARVVVRWPVEDHRASGSRPAGRPS